MADGIAQVQLAEMVVSGLALRYVDRKSGEARDEGRTRPEVIMRQLTTRPGQVERPVLPRLHFYNFVLQPGLHAPPKFARQLTARSRQSLAAVLAESSRSKDIGTRFSSAYGVTKGSCEGPQC